MSLQDSQVILIYGSITPGAIPSPDNLTTNASGVELAVNAADGKLFFKDTAGQVRLLASVSSAEGNSGSADITGGTIDGALIGSVNPSAATFTNLSAQGTVTFNGLSGILKSTGANGVVNAISGVDYLDPTSRGVANGVASLDSNGKVPFAQIPQSITGGLYYAGVWNATTNNPTLTTGVGVAGTFYKVSVSGSTNLNGISTWNVGDEAIFNGISWARIPASQAQVTSVNGLFGDVVLTPSTIGAVAIGANSSITSLSGLTTALSVSQGGTGRSTLSGILKGEGTTGLVSAVAGTDYALPTAGALNQLLANNGTGGFSNVTIGSGLSYNGGVLSATSSSSGTVTSVNASGGTTGLTFTGGPITTTGTVTLSGTLSIANGGTGQVSRQAAINALTDSNTSTAGHYLRSNGTDALLSAIRPEDVPILNQNTTGSAATVTGATQTAITRVGTLLELNVSGAVNFSNELIIGGSAGTSGQVLTSNGPGLPMSWETIDTTSSNFGTVTSVNLSGGTTGLVFGGGPITSTGTITMGGVLSVSSGGTGTTTSTGTGSLVLSTAPIINGATLFNGELNNVSIGATVPGPASFTSVSSTTANLQTLTVTGEATHQSTGGMKIPSGSTSQRGSAVEGKIRYNTELHIFEGYSVNGWETLGGDPVVPEVYKKKISNYTSYSNDFLIADTSGGTFRVELPPSPVPTGSFVRIADGWDFSTNKLTLGRNGSTINGLGLDFDITAKGIEITAVYDGLTWKLYAQSSSGIIPATGSGAPVLSNSPTLVTPNLGTPSLVILTNAMGLPLETGVVGKLSVANGGTGSTTITGLVKGNGNAAMSAAVPGVDYAPATTGPSGKILFTDGSGGFSNVSLGSGLTLTGGTLSTSGGTGTVTSVGLSGGTTGLSFGGSPITSSGTITMAGVLSPVAGGTGTTTLTGLVKGNGTAAMTAATPSVDYAPATTGTSAQLLANNGTGGFSNVTLGSGLFYTNGTLSSTSGTGTVTSVGIDGGTTGLAFGSPITSSGTFNVTGILSPTAGGTGRSSITGLVKGNGSAAMTAAVSGIDYAPATTGSANQILANSGFGGFSNVTLGAGLTLNGGVLNTSGMSPSGNVTSFNSRIGAVVATSGDYNASLITATPSSFLSGLDVQAQLSAVGGDDGSSNVGFKRVEAGSRAQSVSDKLDQLLSVADFVGYDNSGTTSSLAAFVSAYTAAKSGQTILIPSGIYQGVNGLVSGTKYVVWLAEGLPSGSLPQTWDLPGVVDQQTDGVLQSRYEVTTRSSANTSSGTETIRVASYTGGSPSVVNSAQRTTIVVGSQAANQEVGSLITLRNSAVAGIGNRALEIHSLKLAAGSTTGASFSAEDVTLTSDPTGDLSAVDIKVYASGSDSLSTRSGINVYAAKTASGSSAQIGSAIRIGSLGGSTSDAWFKNGIVLNGRFDETGLTINNSNGSVQNGILITGTSQRSVTIGGVSDVGLDLSVGVQAVSAIRLRSGSKLSFTTNDSNQLVYQSGGLSNVVSNSTKHQLIDNGDLFMTGRLSVTSSSLSSSAGSATGQYLTILVDGNPYRIQLLAIS